MEVRLRNEQYYTTAEAGSM